MSAGDKQAPALDFEAARAWAAERLATPLAYSPRELDLAAVINAFFGAELPADLRELESVANAATKGPWMAYGYGPDDRTVRTTIEGGTWPSDPVMWLGEMRLPRGAHVVIGHCGHNVSNPKANAEFIARARTAFPALLAALQGESAQVLHYAAKAQDAETRAQLAEEEAARLRARWEPVEKAVKVWNAVHMDEARRQIHDATIAVAAAAVRAAEPPTGSKP